MKQPDVTIARQSLLAIPRAAAAGRRARGAGGAVTPCARKVEAGGRDGAGQRAGAWIANSIGVPGTLACIARTLHDDRPVLLSNWHVLFGDGQRKGGTIWLVEESNGVRRFSELGRTLYGKIGMVRFGGKDYYVDCSVGSCLHPGAAIAEKFRRAMCPVPFVTGHDQARVGSVVTKTGAGTGTTTGVIVDINHSDSAVIWGRTYRTPRQILVRPLERHARFSAEGDSGALIVDESNKAVGLIWGANTRGEGVACHIGPVMYAMNITMDPLPDRR
jgi:hypothetical protein